MEEKNQGIDEDKLAEAKCSTVETCAPEKKGLSEDWLSFILGLVVFILSLGVFSGTDIFGWAAGNKEWTTLSKAVAPIAKQFQSLKGDIVKIEGAKVTVKKADGKEETVSVQDSAGLTVGGKYEKKGMNGFISLLFTYLFMLVLMTVGAAALRANIGKFIVSFSVVFWISYACFVAGHYAYIAALQPEKAGLSWSLRLSGEAGLIVALLAGLFVGNFMPGFAVFLKEAVRPELYIKTAIVILGAMLGVKAAGALGLATAVMFRGLCAIIEAYLIYWALVYFIARKYFKFSREWAAPLASGISICGVSAAIATGGAIRARPVVPIMVSSLVVIFAVVELIILPFLAQTALWQEPMVAGAWMGLAVKTDGAAVASGGITDALIRAKAFTAGGIQYEEGWMTMAATTTKIFIDVFIGVWAFVLAIIWCAKIECKPGEKVQIGEIWSRFPKFVIGYVITFLIMLAMTLPASKIISPVEKEIKGLNKEIAASQKQLSATTDPLQQAAIGGKVNSAKNRIKELETQIKDPKKTIANANASTSESNIFRVLFFVLTFFTIGVVSNFKKLWEEGIGRLAAVYILCLFGFIIWIGLAISWIFFHGVKPPVISG